MAKPFVDGEELSPIREQLLFIGDASAAVGVGAAGVGTMKWKNKSGLLGIAMTFLCLSSPGIAQKKSVDIDDGVKTSLLAKIRAAFGEQPLVGEIQYGVLPQRKAKTIPVNLPQAGCYRFAVVAENNAADVSLALFAQDAEVARDRLSGRNPAVTWCSRGALSVTAEVLMYSGKGPFALAVFAESANAAPSGTYDVGDGQSDFIGNRIRQLHAHLAAKSRPLSPVFRGHLDTGKSVGFDVSLSGGCVKVIGVGGPSVKDLNLSLHAETGALVGTDNTKSGFAVFDVTRCPLPKGAFTLRITMGAGSGSFGVQVFETAN